MANVQPCITDTATVDLTVSNGNLQADVKIAPGMPLGNTPNDLLATAGGLYMPRVQGITDLNPAVVSVTPGARNVDGGFDVPKDGQFYNLCGGIINISNITGRELQAMIVARGGWRGEVGPGRVSFTSLGARFYPNQAAVDASMYNWTSAVPENVTDEVEVQSDLHGGTGTTVSTLHAATLFESPTIVLPATGAVTYAFRIKILDMVPGGSNTIKVHKVWSSVKLIGLTSGGY